MIHSVVWPSNELITFIVGQYTKTRSRRTQMIVWPLAYHWQYYLH